MEWSHSSKAAPRLKLKSDFHGVGPFPFACHRGRIIGGATMNLKFFAGLRRQTGG